ncbi:CLOCK-interacting pacemaker [Sphaeramia orbicularis]|uniref:CLOCK-interacting pacemaker-like n=1 Tax=Sphaeramia orbicularis TaxID=375764 RepID=A0A673BMD0_9TELE|nr:CLOCK-interacting pacemaker-like [Sphaeramia orbicularis]XP_029984218.1 CLOCK-interacting pacemaker-like [Sphaeramia orbicularis]
MSTKRKAESHSRAANRPRIMKSGGSRAESERDSGFSDASSEHFSTMDTTDSEDSPCPVVQQDPQTPGSGPQPPQLAVVGGSYSSLSPMIIMNNVLLKQPGDNPPALKPWGFSPTVEVVQPVVQQPQVVFLQPVVSRQASTASKDSSTRHRRPKKYLPILKSYPKIAPYPGDSSSSSGRGTASSSSSTSSSSSSSGSERGSGSTSNHQDHCQKEKQQRSPCNSVSNSATHNLPPTPSTVSPLLQNQLSHPTSGTSASNSAASEKHLLTVKQTELTPSLSFTPTIGSKDQELLALGALVNRESSSSGGNNHSDSDADTRRKRFCNTYNILSKSGLLDITLRTKELLRQNRRTQGDLDRLKEHTDLFLQALRSGDTSICVKLQTSLQEEDGEKERERAVQPSSKAD